MQKRLLAIAMSLTMTFSLLPLSAFAEPVDEAEKNKMEISVEPIDDRMTEMEIGKSSTETEQNKKLNMQIFNQKDFPEQTGTTATDGDVVTTSEELANRIQTATDGATIVLGEGTFKTVHNPSPRKSLTFVGAGPKTIWEIGDLKSNTAGESNGDYSFDGCGSITFKNMTLKSDDKDYRGFIRIGNTVADNCVLEGKTAFWGYQTATFKGCTFNAPEGDYALWDYSTKNMVFDDCTFNISGKGVNVYVESGEAEPRTVTMKDCTVKSSASNKAFLNIKNNTQAYDIILIGTNSVEGLTADQTTGSVLYQVEASKITSTQKPVKVQEQAADGTLETIYEVKLPAVAKVGNTEYSTLTDAFSALSAENHVLTLIDQTAWTYQNIYWQAGDQSGSADTLRAAVQAAHAVHSAENIQIICKPETEIADSAAHIDVTRNISIYANGADFTGDDLSIGTYQAPEKEITSVNIYDAKNLVVWGQPVEGRADVWNINFVDCVNDGWNFLMYRGAEKSPAKLNLTLTNCRATGYTDSTVHTTADGSIRIKGCSFADNCAPVNIAHKQSGVMEVVIDSSTFTKCGKVSTNNYFAPVRFVNNNENGTLKAIVTKTTFIDRIGTNGDILIGDGRIGKASYDVELLVQNTEAQVQFQTPGYYNGEGEAINPDYLATAEVSKDETMDSSLSEQFAVAKVGTEFYPSLAEAIAASDSATVILLKNVTENVTIPKAKTITLDLNGCTLSGGTIAGRAALTNHGTVVIRDSGSGGEIIREDNGTSGYYTIDNQGTMTIENGKVYNRTGPMPQGSSLIRNAGNQEAILNILGGEIRHDGFIAIKNDDYGILNIAGGTITTSGDTATHTASAVQNWSKATITGGTINGTIWTGTWSDNLPASSTVIDGENVTITGQIVVRKETSGGQKPSIELKNGNFDISAWNVASGENVDVTVSGGSFTAPVAPEYLADGLNFEAKDSNGIYTYHTKIDDALDAAGSSGTVSSTEENPELEIILPTPTKEGYTFLYWQAEDGMHYKGGEKVKASVFHALTAVWEKNSDQPSGGSSDNERTYAIVTEDDGHGSVAVSADKASAGTRITVTVKPDSGYELDELTVTDAKNKELTVTKRTENTYTFHMADSKVTVEASFSKDGTVQKPDTRFDDVAKSAWYYEAVEYVAENGIMSGVSAREFAPNAGFSRAMLAQTLYAMSGKPDVKAEGTFSDVAANAWYADAVNWAAKKGYVSGVGDGKFAPDTFVTREQLALILYRYAGSPDASDMEQKEFADSSSVSAYAVDAIRWAVHEGLISGMENNTLAPQGTATRAQVAQILMNFHQKLDK